MLDLCVVFLAIQMIYDLKDLLTLFCAYRPYSFSPLIYNHNIWYTLDRHLCQTYVLFSWLSMWFLLSFSGLSDARLLKSRKTSWKVSSPEKERKLKKREKFVHLLLVLYGKIMWIWGIPGKLGFCREIFPILKGKFII